MPRTYRAPTFDRGFTLIEVIAATAVTAMTVAAAATAILLSQRLSDAALFYHEATLQAETLHVQASGAGMDVFDSAAPSSRRIETEEMEQAAPAFQWFRLRDTMTGRYIDVALRSGQP